MQGERRQVHDREAAPIGLTADASWCNSPVPGHGERLMAEALGARGGPRGEVLSASTGGHVRTGDVHEPASAACAGTVAPDDEGAEVSA